MKNLAKTEPCPECGRWSNRGVSIDAVIIKDGSILLIQRGVEPNKGFWGTPGGYVDWDESVEDAVKREVKEETNLDVTNIKLVGVYSDPARHPKQVINVAHLVTVAEGELRHGDDATDARWFSLDDLPEHMALDHKSTIGDVRRLKF